MENEILIIGVGSAGVIAADKMDLPNSKKLFIDRDSYILKDAKSEGNKIKIVCEKKCKQKTKFFELKETAQTF